MQRLSLSTTKKLNNGIEIPILGLGVWQMARGQETEEAVRRALEVGYRHIDTAKLYRNEESVGKAVLESPLPREDVFITTKLWSTDAFDVEGAFATSLQKLGLGYVDLYLIHWPVPLFGNRVWKQLERLYDQKLVRAIGVSNYNVSQLKELLAFANVPPAVNQVEFNAFNHYREMLDYCTAHQIALEAYSPLTRGTQLDDERLVKIGMHYGKNPAHVLLRWVIEKGAIAIPKSSNAQRIGENADIFDFELTKEDTFTLDNL